MPGEKEGQKGKKNKKTITTIATFNSLFPYVFHRNENAWPLANQTIGPSRFLQVAKCIEMSFWEISSGFFRSRRAKQYQHQISAQNINGYSL